MHAQNFGPWAIRIPRIVLVTFGYIVAVIVGCMAARYFQDTLQTFLSVIGYWTVIHLVIVAEEHLIFRRNRWSMYDWDAWASRDLLPFGYASIVAFIFGFS
jgi:purine-cytosine permease-like protein